MILFISMGVIVKYCIDNHYAHPELANDLVMFDVTGYPLFFGLACAILEGNGIILNIESTMKTPEDFNMVLTSAVGFCLMVFCAFATIGYWSYGSTISDFIPLNLPHDDVTDFTQILFCFGLFSSIALQSMPVFDIYESTPFYKEIPAVEGYPQAKRFILRSITVALCAFASMSVPKFGLFINLVGAFSCTALVFVLPIRIYDKVFANDMS